jgi:hypothetical protein
LADAPDTEIYTEDSGGGSGCGCPLAAGSDTKSAGGFPPDGVALSEPVEIGPVVAVVLDGADADALDAWLTDNDFAVPNSAASLVESYSGSGRYFIAVRRSDSAPQGPSSLGLHFTVPGDQRGLPLRFASLGAATSVAFTVFVAAPEPVGPGAPFAALTLDDLSARVLRDDGYAAAVGSAIGQRDGKAFVLERAFRADDEEYEVPSSLSQYITNGATITRLSGVFVADQLTDDVVFDQPYALDIPTERHVASSKALNVRHASAVGLSLLLVVAACARRRGRAACI